MIKMDYDDDSNIRSIDRSLYRNMPSSCIYCGYRNRPSSLGINCNVCCLKMKQVSKEMK